MIECKLTLIIPAHRYPKEMINTPCGCALRCFNKVNQEQRKKLFDGYWTSADFNVQSTY